VHLLDHPDFKLIEHDVIEPFDKLNLDVDQIYNLACPASPPHYQQDPLFTTKTAIFGVINCLELGRKTGARVFQASTSEVYGDPLVHPQPESYWGSVNPIGIRSCYDEGKRVGETLMFDYYRQYGVDIRVVRIFNTYGPRMNPEDGRVVSNFIVQALRGENITIYGDGKQTRSFCYVDDLLEGFIRLMNQDEVVGPINCGNPGEFTMLELAEKVLAKVKSKSKLTFHPLPGDDPKQRKPDITLAKKHLNWEPEVDLDKGLDKAIEYFSGMINK
jgi:UDP-glucuronate decarboxylase